VGNHLRLGGLLATAPKTCVDFRSPIVQLPDLRSSSRHMVLGQLFPPDVLRIERDNGTIIWNAVLARITNRRDLVTRRTVQ